MTDVERDLREMFGRRERDVGVLDPIQAPPGLVRRARRRQALMVGLGSLGAVAVVIGIIAGVAALMNAEPRTPIGPNPSPAPSPIALPSEAEVLVASGETEGWSWWLYTSTDGSCRVLADAIGASSSCWDTNRADATLVERRDVGVFPELPAISILSGVTSADAARVRVSMDDGTDVEAALYPRPAGVEGDGLYFVVAIPGVRPPEVVHADVEVLDRDGSVIDRVEAPWPSWGASTTRRTIADGDDAIGGRWIAFLTRAQDGSTNVFIDSENGSGGGSGCCARPRDGEAIRIGGSTSGTGMVQVWTGTASTDVARVVYVHSDGTEFAAHVVSAPEDVAGPLQLVVLFLPEAQPANGEIVAFDAAGAELGRAFVGSAPEEAGPTTAIDQAWTALRSARDATQRWLLDHDSLIGFTTEAAGDIEPSLVWNDDPLATRGEVSVRDVHDDRLVLTTQASSGETFCVSVYVPFLGEGGRAGEYRYGTQDAPTYNACGGGW